MGDTTSFQQAFAEFLALWQEKGYRYSDLLRVQSELCRAEATKFENETISWLALSHVLNSAVAIAEIPERELP